MPTLATRLAIDLTGGLIRVVDGALGGPMRCGSGGTPAGSLVDGKVVDVVGVGSALRQLLARTDIENTQALIAASDSVASFRVLKARRSDERRIRVGSGGQPASVSSRSWEYRQSARSGPP